VKIRIEITDRAVCGYLPSVEESQSCGFLSGDLEGAAIAFGEVVAWAHSKVGPTAIKHYEIEDRRGTRRKAA
jgi:hypothetical protein